MQPKRSSNLYKIWRLLSIATIFTFSFLFVLFFLIFIFGYALILQEPDIYIAFFELIVGLNALIYVWKSSHISLHWPKYSWLFAALLQPFDLLTTWLGLHYGQDVGELNGLTNAIGGPFSPANFFYKLVLIPFLCCWIQFKLPNLKLKYQMGTIPFLFYLVVVIINLIPLVI
jgi:hypothetical protein